MPIPLLNWRHLITGRYKVGDGKKAADSHRELSAANNEGEGLLDGDPDGLTPTLGFHDFLFEAVNPDAAVEHFAHFAVLAYQDAAFGVFRAVACVDADALEFRNTEQDRQPFLKLWRVRYNHGVAPFGDGRSAFYLMTAMGIISPSGFQCVAEID